MKIVSPPTNPAFTTVRFSCTHCGTVFDTDPEERKSHFDKRQDSYYWQAECPTCTLNCYESQ